MVEPSEVETAGRWRQSRWKPAVAVRWLYLLSGLMWSGVGVLLCSRAASWLVSAGELTALAAALVGLMLAFAIARWGFCRVAAKNIRRIAQMSGSVCLFAFQSWQSYLLVAFMMSLGLGLRHSPLPKEYLAILYVGIGGALFLASGSYYQRFWSGRGRIVCPDPD